MMILLRRPAGHLALSLSLPELARVALIGVLVDGFSTERKCPVWVLHRDVPLTGDDGRKFGLIGLLDCVA